MYYAMRLSKRWFQCAFRTGLVSVRQIPASKARPTPIRSSTIGVPSPTTYILQNGSVRIKALSKIYNFQVFLTQKGKKNKRQTAAKQCFS
jgi:hypothetical protein